jgi:hypothetical protein
LSSAAAVVGSVSMNKLTGQRQTVGSARSITTRRKRQAASIIAVCRRRGICSYTNDVARAAESCQAPCDAKNPAAE